MCRCFLEIVVIVEVCQSVAHKACTAEYKHADEKQHADYKHGSTENAQQHKAAAYRSIAAVLAEHICDDNKCDNKSGCKTN